MVVPHPGQLSSGGLGVCDRSLQRVDHRAMVAPHLHSSAAALNRQGGRVTGGLLPLRCRSLVPPSTACGQHLLFLYHNCEPRRYSNAPSPSNRTCSAMIHCTGSGIFTRVIQAVRCSGVMGRR